MLTTSVLKQREVPATVSTFYVSVVYTAMLRTCIAAVVLGCFYFCPFDCDASVIVVDCAAVETGCVLDKYVKVATKYVFIFIFWSRCCCFCVLLLLPTSVRTEAERGTGCCFFLLRLRCYYCCFLCVYSIAVAAVEKGYAFLFFGRAAAAANHFSCWLRCCCCWCLCCLQHQY